MRTTLFILFLIFSLTSWSQITFTSPITRHFPSGELELINRTITFDGKEFIIKSPILVNTFHVQKWIIKEHAEIEFPMHGLAHFYVCESIDGMYTTYILIPAVDVIEYIEVLQPWQLNMEPRHHRFLVD